MNIDAKLEPTDSLEIQIDGQTAESWSSILAQFVDANIYQTWAYGAVRWGSHNLSHLVLRHGDCILAAAQLRIVRLPFIPGGIAYIRWGPVWQKLNSELDPAILTKMLNSLREEYCHRRGFSLQIIPNAWNDDLLGLAYLNAFQRSGLKPDPRVPIYRTVLVDLTPSPDLLRKQLNQKWRNQLNRAEKNGLALDVMDNAASYQEFLSLYDAMRTRKGFETSVDVREFGRIQQNLLPTQKTRVFIARKNDEAIAALVCSVLGNRAIYILGATNEKARELKAAYFIQWQAMLWIKSHGISSYDLGGIDPETNPGGYHFKSGLGGEEFVQINSHSCSGSMFSRGWAILAGWRQRQSSASTSIKHPGLVSRLE